MLQLASNKTDLDTILDELDINKDGGIDLWEFCVYLQRTRERRKIDDSNYELDQAFELFDTGEEGLFGSENNLQYNVVFRNLCPVRSYSTRRVTCSWSTRGRAGWLDCSGGGRGLGGRPRGRAVLAQAGSGG